jgi:sterol desaturase/sphingolipid hydroxylase (fatty acid hydroxylase superfamily)
VERSAFRRVFEVSIFPVVMVGAMWTCLEAIDRGANVAVAALSCQAAAYLIVIVCERLIPLHESWLHSDGDMRVDAAHWVTTLLVGRTLSPLIIGGGILIAGWLSTNIGLGFWPHGWPLVAQIVLSVVVVEAFHYWVHRLEHTTDILWRIHATHHAVPRLYWMNAQRFHFLDTLALAVTGFLPLIALGAPVEMIALWTLFSSVHGIFQHANLPIRLGPLNWIFSMAELHRWHHSPKMEEANHNYGQNIILYDILFGTRYLPKDREPPEHPGIESLPTFPMTWWAQVLSPFRWKQIKAASASATASTAKP